jgi:hypothetical protein
VAQSLDMGDRRAGSTLTDDEDGSDDLEAVARGVYRDWDALHRVRLRNRDWPAERGYEDQPDSCCILWNKG